MFLYAEQFLIFFMKKCKQYKYILHEKEETPTHIIFHYETNILCNNVNILWCTQHSGKLFLFLAYFCRQNFLKVETSPFAI